MIIFAFRNLIQGLCARHLDEDVQGLTRRQESWALHGLRANLLVA